jgi:hypothetical protein
MEERLEDMKAQGDPSRNEYGAASGSLADIDAFQFGIERTRDFFPGIAKRHEERKLEEYRELLASDPVKLHSDLMVEYSTVYVADMGRRLLELRHDHDAFQSGLREHEAAKPGWLKNLATLGGAGKAWTDGWERLVLAIAGSEENMAELQRLREECKGGWLSETAREHAKGEMRSRNPEVIEACERHMARHWKKKNEARLEIQETRQAERDGGDGKTQDNGIWR